MQNIPADLTISTGTCVPAKY